MPRSSPPPSRRQSTRPWARERALKRLQRVLTTFKARGVRFARRRPGRRYISPSIPRSGLRTNWAGPFGAPALYNASTIVGRVALGQHQPSRSAAFALCPAPMPYALLCRGPAHLLFQSRVQSKPLPGRARRPCPPARPGLIHPSAWRNCLKIRNEFRSGACRVARRGR